MARGGKYASLALVAGLHGLASATPISQVPLQVGGGAPGNLVLLPSTAHSSVAAAAHSGDTYIPERTYVGYFDPAKCYGQEPAQQYFQPLRAAQEHLCSGAWSGNFLNWATAQRLDVVRSALTGGDRYIDTAGTTVLQKARNTEADGSFPDRHLSTALAGGATPFSGLSLSFRIAGQDRSLLFSRSPAFAGEPQDYLAGTVVQATETYRLPVRVQVCVAGLLERNCHRYGGQSKPEGLLQQYASRLQVSVLGRADSDGTSNVVLRARHKFIGPQLGDGADNPQAEWSARSGIFLANPDRDASGRSGVIDYLNRFDEAQLRRGDDLGESLHAATRYLRNQGSLAAPADAGAVRVFPAVAPWGDPISHACQRNSVLGLGGAGEARIGESLPRLAGKDLAVDMAQAGRRVAAMEGVGADDATLDFAGLAYDAHTRDLRPDLPGRQTLSTYWLPLESAGQGSALWLATKYGGFFVPKGYSDARDAPLPAAWWHDAAISLAVRPDNLLDATEPARWRDELQRAFARTAESGAGAFSQFIAGGRSDEVFSTTLNPARWSGDLLLWQGSSAKPVWSAAQRLDELDEARLGGRNIFTVRTPDGSGIARQGLAFAWSALDDRQREALAAEGNDGERLVDYLRGSRLEERDSAASPRPYRQRGSRLGDIVHSRPAYSWHDPQPYAALPQPLANGLSLGSAYRDFLDSATYRQRAPLVVVGANDGMLHGFDARDGRELFAYVPAAVFAHLRELAAPGYVHRYFVDGSPSIGNAWIEGRWRTLLVGTPGAGGNSVFALDISDPQRMQPGSVLWEFSHPELGYSLGRPALLALASGRFVVALSSGARDPQGKDGELWLLDAADGRPLKRVRLPGAGDLGPVTAISSTGDVTADRLYLGDSRGNLWRVDLAGDDGQDSAIPASLAGGALFKAVDAKGVAQVISAPVVAARDGSGAVRVMFGTGRYYRVGDNLPAEPEKVESLYGVLDDGTATVGRTRLSAQGLDVESLARSADSPGDGSRGWYLDLPADGTRVIERAQLRADRFVLFNLMTPGDDPCDDPLRYGSVALDIASGGDPGTALPVVSAAGNVVFGRPGGLLVRPGEGESGVRLTTLDEDGRPRSRDLDWPGDSGRKAWQELR